MENNLLIASVLSCVHSVQLFGVEVTCPKNFIDGLNFVSCKINMTAIKEADCSSVQPVVTFDRTVNTFGSMRCHTPSFNSSACSPVQKPAADSCWCNTSDGNIFEYIFYYKANHTQDVGAQLECKICLSPNKFLDVEISDHCRNLAFEDPPLSLDPPWNEALSGYQISLIVMCSCVSSFVVILIII